MDERPDSDESTDEGDSKRPGAEIGARIIEGLVLVALLAALVGFLFPTESAENSRGFLAGFGVVLVVFGGLQIRFTDWMTTDASNSIHSDPTVTRFFGVASYLLGVFAISQLFTP